MLLLYFEREKIARVLTNATRFGLDGFTLE